MVHVISCHHFVSQEVFQSHHEPTAFCCSQGKTLVATEEQGIRIHDLDSRGNVLHSFSSVDQVTQIVYCDSGNYIATLENKSAKHVTSMTHVRIYFNWWMDPRGHPIKVRIAGSSPPTGSETWNDHFEMVELPLRKAALCIACCKTTAALGVSLGKSISVFCYNAKPFTSYRTHDFSHFIDIEMNFVVRELNMCKNYFACLAVNQVQVFKVSIAKEDLNSQSSNLKERNKADKDLDEHFVEWRFEPCTGNAVDLTWENDLRGILHPSSFPISITVKSIEKENQNSDRLPRNCEIIGPLLTVNGFRIKVKLNPNAFEIWPSISSTNIDAVTLLYRQFEFDDVESMLMSLHLVSFFKSDEYNSRLDPLHAAAIASEESFSSLAWSASNLEAHPQLNAIGCFFSTTKEGFLYDVTEDTCLIATYTYTSPLRSAVLDSSFLHALTDAGLETYTLHLAHRAIQHVEKPDGIMNACPDYSSPVCLMGLRPFLGATKLLMAESHLVVISSLEDAGQSTDSDGGNCTLYALQKPLPQQVFSDLLETGQTYKSSSPSTYNLILKEGHMILRTHLFLSQNHDPEVECLFRKSCVLLADYYTCSSGPTEKNLAAAYYHLSKLSVQDVVQEILGFQNQFKQSNVLKVLIQYLNPFLLDHKQANFEIISKTIAESILDAYFEEAPENLWKVILSSELSNYRIEKAMLMLKRRITTKRHLQTSASIAADTFALVSLLLRKGNTDSAQSMLMSIQKVDLVDILHENYQCVWKNTELTSLGKLVRKARPEAFVDMLSRLLKNKQTEVTSVLDLLQVDTPNVVVAKVPQMKEFLEMYWKECKSEFLANSALQSLLLDIYLYRLGNDVPIATSAKSSFSFRTRPHWLNKLPPFNGQTISRNCTKNGASKSTSPTDGNSCCCFSCNEDLIKLQCLLSHPQTSEELFSKFRFVLSVGESEDIKGYLSLKILSLPEDEALEKLAESCPSAIFQFCLDTFKDDEQKWAKVYKILSKKIKTITEDDPKHEVFSQIYHKVLNHIAEISSVASLVELLSNENKDFIQPYVKRCCDKHQANQLRNKIIALGNEIKLMM